MSRITYATVCAWLRNDAPRCAGVELDKLRQLLDEACEQQQVVQRSRELALEKMQAIAKEAGFTNLEELVGQPAAPTGYGSYASLRRQSDQIRKPHMNPLDKNASEIYALTKMKAMPDWAEKLLTEGWSMRELEAKNHADALRARKLPQLYDAVARHSEIVAREREKRHQTTLTLNP